MKTTVIDPAPWRRLAKEARKAADAPGQTASPLARAEKAARKAAVIGELSKSNPCVQLVRQSRAFVAATARGRRELTSRLLALVGQVEQLASTPSQTADPDPPTLPYRADIDG
ncbi:hypothetical protein [Brevundimonas sp.]|uniref:hypothetical protein n=1 Tax=Brevundimonas sp. TaxID=1871086 RepID=UPI00286B6861|nr:hypothetical protein [Brevundimonas sp.]